MVPFFIFFVVRTGFEPVVEFELVMETFRKKFTNPIADHLPT
jgi:hypothetical protein